MSPAATAQSGPTDSFPRVSGDEPDAAVEPSTFTQFSPRERG